jgi:hypothetical protein
MAAVLNAGEEAYKTGGGTVADVLGFAVKAYAVYAILCVLIVLIIAMVITFATKNAKNTAAAKLGTGAVKGGLTPGYKYGPGSAV